MEILVIGSEGNLAEFQEKFKAQNEYHFHQDYPTDPGILEEIEIVFDFYLGDDPTQFEFYDDYQGILFVNSPKITLTELAYYQDSIACTLFGFNGLPTFVNRSLLEVSTISNEKQLDSICQVLDTEFQLVEDRVGMVTPRVICMIINEAFFTLQEGTASVEDIDNAMKLGTNYPHGPFEWSEKIGIAHVYELLEAIYEDTKDERYKICPLLKKSYLQQ